MFSQNGRYGGVNLFDDRATRARVHMHNTLGIWEIGE